MSRTHRIYFVDTSYLLELYAVPGFSEPSAVSEVRVRFVRAWKRKDRLFVPLGCLLEYGNHVADIKSEHDRLHWAQQLQAVMGEVLDERRVRAPFRLTEAPTIAGARALVEAWCEGHVHAPRGLVDAATAEKALAFKRERAMGNPVHIWTRDRRLKGVEPDPEPDPFV